MILAPGSNQLIHALFNDFRCFIYSLARVTKEDNSDLNQPSLLLGYKISFFC